MRVLDLFSGIGGFSLGLERAGMETVAFCEIESFCRKVLKKHWPNVPIYEDVRELTNERLRTDGIFPDIITGGFPCQDISVAGKQKGIEGERSGLWSECARLLGDIRPAYAIFENVTALLSGDNGKWFERVLWDISQVGYDAEWHCIPASALGAHHHRDRVWIIAYPTGHHVDELPDAPNREVLRSNIWNFKLRGQNLLGSKETLNTNDVGVLKSAICGKNDGLHTRVHRLKALGNAVVPQIPELIGKAIMSIHHGH